MCDRGLGWDVGRLSPLLTFLCFPGLTFLRLGCLSIRLFSTRSFKPLGTLPYHRDTCHVLAFANAPLPLSSASDDGEGDAGGEDERSDDDDDSGLVRGRGRWLASGGTDARVAVWELMDFEGKSGTGGGGRGS